MAGGLFYRSLTLHEVRLLDFFIVPELSQRCAWFGNWPGVVVSYVINASDLRAVTPGNELCKYADDT